MIGRMLLALLAALLCLGAAPEPTVLIRGARVFDGSGTPARERDVLVRGSRVAAVGRRLKAPRGAQVIDAAGMTLIPGLHDLHIHTRASAFDGPAALTQGYAAYLAHGVTSVNEYSVSGEMLAGIRAAAREADVPHLSLAVRLGVPGGHGTESGFTDSITTQVATPAEAHVAMRRLLRLRPDLIKVFADGWRYGRDGDRPDMDLPTLSAIVRDARRAGIPVVTHTVTLAGAKIAARAGVTAIVHGIGDAPVDQEMIRLMKRHRMAYVPTMAVYEPPRERRFLPAEWQKLTPEDRAGEEAARAEPAAPMPDYQARRWTLLKDNLRALKAAGIPIGVGTDTGIRGVYQGSATIRELRLLVGQGFTPAEALAAATRVSASIMHQGKRHGRIAAGQRADLVLIAGRPDERIEDLYAVRRVFVSGRDVRLAQ
jgi:imidazolonepropionase-like amidohydrolase